MSLRPLEMEHFVLAIPRTYEDEVMESLARLGVIQPTKEKVEIGEEVKEVASYDELLRLGDRVSTMLASLGEVLKIKRSFVAPKVNLRLNLDEIESFTRERAKVVDQMAREIEDLERENGELQVMSSNLEFLEASRVKINQLRKLEHIFVKVGFLQNVFVAKLPEYLADLETIFEVKPGRPRESLVFIVGDLRYEANVDRALTLLNFEKIEFPAWLDPDPQTALQEVNARVDSNLAKLRQEYSELLEVYEDILERTTFVDFLRESKSSLMRTSELSLLYGWVPARYVPLLKEKTETLTGKIAYLKFVEPTHEKPAPVALRESGVLSKFQMLTVLRGVPGYFEVDPTIIFALLFVVMYGMMFGDVGEGLIISLWGAIFVKRAKGFMGISRSGINKLGWIMLFSGMSAAFFGIMYGDVFLYESNLLFGLRQALHLPALGPLTDIDKITQMMVIALLFGVISLLLALTLGFTNKFLREGAAEAILSGKGLLGIILYVAGVVLVYRVVTSGMNIGVFLYPSNLPLTLVCITAVFLVLLSPLMLSIIRKRRRNRAETIFEGFGEAIETFIGLLANSFSYLRLAAFAMAHAALGLAAVMLSPIAGSITAYVMMNVIGVLIEGFAVGIQSMRLLFYEFSTKFYVGEGIRYRPLKLTTSFVRPQTA